MTNEYTGALIGLLLHIIGSVSTIRIGERVADLRLSIFYDNTQHEADNGYCDRSFNDNWCDTYFNICVSTYYPSEECNLYSITTETHYDKSFVRYSGKDAFRIPLIYPIPEDIRIEISAYDDDRYTSDDFIASFKNDVVSVPAPNRSMNANLVKAASDTQSTHVNITAILSLECIKGFYGEKCSIECFPERHPSTLGCHENGTSICLPGFRGQFCDKPDACFYKPCILGAECMNVDTMAGYKCICGGIEGVHCYAGYNPCVPSQCKNQGQCVRTGEKHDTFTCNCPIQWTGELCDMKRSPCEVASQKLANADLQDLFGMPKLDNYSFTSDNAGYKSINVCKNGGVCVDLMDTFKFICNCTRGWRGELCTVPVWTNAIIAGCAAMGSLMILLCAIVPCCLRMKALRRKKSQNPVEPLTYSHDTTKYPITERIPFKDIFYNSVLLSDTLDSQNSARKQPFYEYCTVNTPSFSESELVPFTPDDYETLSEDKPPPELPIRPDSLAPLPKSLTTFVRPDSDLLPSSRPESMYSRQLLLTPRNSDFSPVLEKQIDNEYANSDGLPRRSAEIRETTLPKLLHISKK